MLIEVSEKEARRIYAQRYTKENGGYKFCLKCYPGLIIALPVGFWISTFTSIGSWLPVVAVAISVSPALYFSLRLIRASGKYTQSQIEEVKQ